jgi:hypothetical protein
MKKYLLGLIVGLILIVPFKVEATDYNYDVCSESSCTYHDIDSVVTAIKSTTMAKGDLYTINVGKGTFDYTNSNQSYVEGYNNSFGNSNSIVIKGLDSTNSKIKIKNFFLLQWFDDVEISNISFVGNSSSYSDIDLYDNASVTLTNVNLNSFVSDIDNFGILLLDGNMEAKLTNVSISDSNSYYGIAFNFNGKYTNSAVLDNINISGTKEGITTVNEDCGSSTVGGGGTFVARLGEILPNPVLNINIKNSKINADTCSVVMNYNINSCDFNAQGKALSPQSYVPDSIDSSKVDYTSITNSTIGCLKAVQDNKSGSSTTDVNPIIYADYTNTWSSPPSRGANVLEVGNAKVYYDLFTKKDVSVILHSGTNLADIIPASELANITYEIEDETVARITDNKIVGLRTGTTKVIARSGLNVYQFSVSVISNPTTDTALTVFVMLFVLVVLATVVTYTLKLENKIN